MARKIVVKHSNTMQATNSQETAAQPTASQQEEVEFVALRKVDPSNERPIVSEAWQQCEQEETDQTFSPSILNSTADAYGSFHFAPSQQTPIVTTSSQAHHVNRPASQPCSQITSSQPAHTYLSAFDWNSFDVFSQSQTQPRHDAETGRLVQQQHSSYSPQASASIRMLSSELVQASCSTTVQNNAFSTKPNAPGRGTASYEDEAGRLKNIEESIHCFWLVSENRMRDVENELKDVTASIKSTQYEQEQIGSQLSQILPLQVQIAQKVVRAADEKKIIFGRIKSLEESSAAWQKEMKSMLEAMQTELRAGMEMISDLAAVKVRKPPASKAKNEASAASAASAASTALAAPAVAPTKNTNNKRPSPPRKKTSPAGSKKVKLPPADDHDSAAVATSLDIAPATPPKQELAEQSQAVTQAARVAQQQQQPDYDYQQPHQAYQQHQQHPHYHQPRPQTAGAWSREYQFQSHSQPVVPNHRELTFDQVQLLPRPHTAAPGCAHDLRSNMSAIETSLRH